MNIGEQINNLRKQHGLSQDDFANLFNVSRQTISNWENGKSYPDLEMIIKVSDYFKISIDELLKNDQLHIDSIVETISEKNADMFAKESLEINRWAEDMTGSLQLKANILREKRKEKQRLLDYAITSAEQEELEKEISDLTKKIKNMWLELSDAEESVEEKRRNMISKLKKEQMKTTTINKIFAIEFKVV